MPRFMMIQVSGWVREIESTLWLPRHKAGSTGCDATTTTHHIYAQAAIPSDRFHVPDPLSSLFPPKKLVFPKIMIPPNHPLKNRVWNHYKPSIHFGWFSPYFWKHPNLFCPTLTCPFKLQTPGKTNLKGESNHRLWCDNNPMTCDQHESSAMWPQTVL